jgi:hypothetical protein
MAPGIVFPVVKRRPFHTYRAKPRDAPVDKFQRLKINSNLE